MSDSEGGLSRSQSDDVDPQGETSVQLDDQACAADGLVSGANGGAESQAERDAALLGADTRAYQVETKDPEVSAPSPMELTGSVAEGPQPPPEAEGPRPEADKEVVGEATPPVAVQLALEEGPANQDPKAAPAKEEGSQARGELWTAGAKLVAGVIALPKDIRSLGTLAPASWRAFSTRFATVSRKVAFAPAATFLSGLARQDWKTVAEEGTKVLVEGGTRVFEYADKLITRGAGQLAKSMKPGRLPSRRALNKFASQIVKKARLDRDALPLIRRVLKAESALASGSAKLALREAGQLGANRLMRRVAGAALPVAGVAFAAYSVYEDIHKSIEYSKQGRKGDALIEGLHTLTDVASAVPGVGGIVGAVGDVGAAVGHALLGKHAEPKSPTAPTSLQPERVDGTARHIEDQ